MSARLLKVSLAALSAFTLSMAAFLPFSKMQADADVESRYALGADAAISRLDVAGLALRVNPTHQTATVGTREKHIFYDLQQKNPQACLVVKQPTKAFSQVAYRQQCASLGQGAGAWPAEHAVRKILGQVRPSIPESDGFRR